MFPERTLFFSVWTWRSKSVKMVSVDPAADVRQSELRLEASASASIKKRKESGKVKSTVNSSKFSPLLNSTPPVT